MTAAGGRRGLRFAVCLLPPATRGRHPKYNSPTGINRPGCFSLNEKHVNAPGPFWSGSPLRRYFAGALYAMQSMTMLDCTHARAGGCSPKYDANTLLNDAKSRASSSHTPQRTTC
ncbi:hypothetical protein BCEP4_680056 [Burkholderia cepacia]|nr:hypothetical protein BCEP4_680056 [Burkholderia cepacia]